MSGDAGEPAGAHGGVEIRELGASDLDALLALYDGHLHQDDDPRPERARVEALWERIVGDADYVYLGGFVGGTLVSACNAVIVANLTRGARPYAIIENVVTHPAHRRHGVATRVIGALVDRCLARDCYKVSLTSAAGRGGAHELYTRLGFDGEAKRAFVITRR